MEKSTGNARAFSRCSMVYKMAALQPHKFLASPLRQSSLPRGGLVMGVELQDTYRYNAKIRQHSPKEQQLIRQWIAEGTDNGWIEPSKAKNSTVLIFVLKKDTTKLRPCADYRELNKVLNPEYMLRHQHPRTGTRIWRHGFIASMISRKQTTT